MNIFRIFFVSTVLIPVLVVVATSDESGIRVRKPRSVLISEDGTRSGRRHNPVNISDRDCPSVGCSGNLTNSYNGKGNLASTSLPGPGTGSSTEERFDSEPNALHRHNRPLKLEIKTIKNSTTVDDSSNTVLGGAESGRSFEETADVIIAWFIWWAWKAFCAIVVVKVVKYLGTILKTKSGVGDDYIEYYVKLGKDEKHPFVDYAGGWNPTFGVSLKSKYEHQGWNGWASSYQQHSHGPSPYHGWAPYGGPPHKGGKGWKSSSEEEEENLREEFDKKKGWKYAKKYAKKYGKKAHKYGLRPNQFSNLYDQKGNIVDTKLSQHGWAWRPPFGR